MEHLKSLTDLVSEMSLCKNCPLNQSPYDPGLVVPGVGSPTARVFAIGEAPGEVESKTGVPFVGPAGKLLQDLMIQAGYDADSIYVTNAVKHRPPSNRTPTVEERKACSHFLAAQILAVNPRVILAIGKSAAKAVAELGGVEIPDTGLRGYTFTIGINDKTWPVFCTWHPAYVLRNPKGTAGPELLSDLKAVLTFAELPDDCITSTTDNYGSPCEA